MDAAVTGLVGVLVGSAITGSWQFALAYRKDRRERRAAARLIAAELKRIYGLLLAPTASDLALTLINQLPEQTPAWQDHQGALAADLASGDWATVARAYVNLPALLALRIIDFEQADRDLRNTVRRIASDT